jgi:hypothetical protein
MGLRAGDERNACARSGPRCSSARGFSIPDPFTALVRPCASHTTPPHLLAWLACSKLSAVPHSIYRRSAFLEIIDGAYSMNAMNAVPAQIKRAEAEGDKSGDYTESDLQLAREIERLASLNDAERAATLISAHVRQAVAEANRQSVDAFSDFMTERLNAKFFQRGTLDSFGDSGTP